MAKRDPKRNPSRPARPSRPSRPRPAAPGESAGRRQHSSHGPRANTKRASLPPRKSKNKNKPTELPQPELTLGELLHPPFRIGHGYDLHRLEPLAPAGSGRPFILGGVLIDPAGTFGRGPVAHSDGDVLLHAITDALLGAIGQHDIGQLFPDNAPENDGRDSADFLLEAVRRVHAAGYRVGNLDCTVILEKPKLSPHKSSIRGKLASWLAVPEAMVNLKGKTHEKVDAVGESRAVEAHVVVLLIRSVA